MSIDTDMQEQLIAHWIEPNPHHPSLAEAWVLPGHVSLWVVIRQLQLEHWEPEGITEGYGLPAEAVQAAVAYYQRHQAVVDDRIAQSRAFFGT